MNLCPTCGKEIAQPARGRTKIYCDDTCRSKSRYEVRPSEIKIKQAGESIKVIATSANRLMVLETGLPVLDLKLHMIAEDIKASIETHLPEVYHG